MIKDDFDLLVYKLPRTQEKVNIYGIGDSQIGSPNFDKGLFKAWSNKVLADPFAKVIIVGDMVNNGLKGSKTDSYRETVPPREAKRWLVENLKPMQHLIIGAVKGNHEERSTHLTDDCPLYDALAKLDLEDLYRENAVFIKVNVGEKSNKKQVSYTIVGQHGTSEKKTENFSYAIDNMDVYFTGHIHRPKSAFPSKIVIDSHNETVRMIDYNHIIVPAFDRFGGYVLRGQYMPQSSSKIPIVELNGKEKEVNVHWITLKSS